MIKQFIIFKLTPNKLLNGSGVITVINLEPVDWLYSQFDTEQEAANQIEKKAEEGETYIIQPAYYKPYDWQK